MTHEISDVGKNYARIDRRGRKDLLYKEDLKEFAGFGNE